MYPLTPEIFSKALEKKTNDIQVYHQNISVDFWNLHRGFEWKNDEDRALEYTGNESRPGHCDSIYINLAAIVLAQNNDKKLKIET